MLGEASENTRTIFQLVGQPDLYSASLPFGIAGVLPIVEVT